TLRRCKADVITPTLFPRGILDLYLSYRSARTFQLLEANSIAAGIRAACARYRRGRDRRAPIPPLPPHERLETPALQPRPPEGPGQPYSSTQPQGLR
ncbi:hypothetical protein L249_5957, partial [Ophiocordyceps polyrhachis-furcata BCC 54312]